MTSLPKHSLLYDACPVACGTVVPDTGRILDLRFPGGPALVRSQAADPVERTFAEFYLRDVQLCIDSTPERWRDWRQCLSDEACPVMEFDLDWFSFLLPPKDQTRLELFAWYWLWIDSDRRLSVPHYVFLELREAFKVARRFHVDDAGLARAVSRINAALNTGQEDFAAFCAWEGEGEFDLSRFAGRRLWFPGLLVDFDQAGSSPKTFNTHDEATVWGYTVSGGTDLSRVSGQVKAVLRDGQWRFEPGALRSFRRSAKNPEQGIRSASPE